MKNSQLLDKFPIISDQIKRPALQVVLGECERVLDQGTLGDLVEFGCYIGTTSLFIRRLLNEYGQSDKRAFHVYDSFEGLPEKTTHDQSAAGIYFKGGELSVSKKQFLHEFQKANLQPPITHKGWFKDVQDVPEQIAFAFLDGDFYESILDSLKLVWPRMVEGGVICIDDYQRETLPGVERAVNDFFQGKPKSVVKMQHNIGTLRLVDRGRS